MPDIYEIYNLKETKNTTKELKDSIWKYHIKDIALKSLTEIVTKKSK